MENEKAGLKDTKELFAGVFAIVKPIVKEIVRDGFQASDLLSFLSSEEFKNEITPAIDGISNVPSEMKDIDLEEIFELAGFSLVEIKDLVKIIKEAKVK